MKDKITLREVRDLYKTIDNVYDPSPEDCLFIVKTADDLTIPAIKKSCLNFKKIHGPRVKGKQHSKSFQKSSKRLSNTAPPEKRRKSRNIPRRDV